MDGTGPARERRDRTGTSVLGDGRLHAEQDRVGAALRPRHAEAADVLSRVILVLAALSLMDWWDGFFSSAFCAVLKSQARRALRGAHLVID